MSNLDLTVSNDLHKSWGWFLALGLLLMAGGATALYVPFGASLAVEVVVGIAMLMAGLLTLVQVFTTDDGWEARLIYLILGVFNVVAGVLIFMHPLQGLVALTLVMIVAFFVNGLMRIAMGIMARPEKGSGWIIFFGVVSVLASIYLLTRFPEISVVLLGVMAAIHLISEGAGYTRFAYGLKTAKIEG